MSSASKKAVDTTTQGDTSQFITFAVDTEEFAVDITSVREIKAWTQTTNLPNAENYMRGVINLRGSIVPIYDLRALFGKGRTKATKNHVIVIVAVEERTIGILVDAVSDIISLGENQIQEPPSRNQTDKKAFIAGLSQVGDRLVMLLRTETLLHLDELDETFLAQAMEEYAAIEQAETTSAAA